MKTANRVEPGHVRMARAGLDISVRELAAMSGVNKATIVRVEAGHPVRNSTMDAIISTLRDRGAAFYYCRESNEISVGLVNFDD